MKPPKQEQMTENEESQAQQVATDFITQYLPEDFYVMQESADRLKAHIQAVCLATLQFAEENTGKTIHILPGRPSRPQKPTV